MSLLSKLLPWYKLEEDDVKDARTEVAVLKAQKIESHVRKLALTYQAAGLLVKDVRQKGGRAVN